MGVVFRAHDQRLDRDVAIKLLPSDRFADESDRRRFRREAMTLSRLSHPNIATIFDFSTSDALDFLVMEYVRGITLADRLARGPMSEKETLAIGMQIANALEDAHDHGIIHCDLKPANIMVAAHQQVKLLDFGLARLLQIGDITTAETVSMFQKIAGTLPYMSPEQLRGDAADPRSDIYSTGAVIYEMLTAHRPFEQKSSPSLIDDILNKIPSPPAALNPNISPRLQDVVMKCLEKDPEDRFQSARELAVDLRRLSNPSTLGGQISAAALDASRTRALRRRRIWIVAAVLAVLVVAGLISWRWLAVPRQHQVVLIGDFQNRTDERVFDNAVPELLAISLEQSGHISLFPYRRIAEVLKLMKRPPAGPIDETTGQEICQREGLNAFILGSITKLGSQYVLTARAIGADGQNLASAADEIHDPGELPASLDRISKELRKALGESSRQIEQSSVPLAQVTSASVQAIRSFSAGKQQLYAGEIPQARANFERAVELDSSFAMAHEYLGLTYLHQGDPVRAKQELQKTLAFIDHVTEPEKEKILGDYNFLRRDFDQAIIHFRLLKQLRERDSAPALNLAQCYVGKLDFDAALVETKAAIAMEPAAGPLNNLAEIYMLKGDIHNALLTAQDIVGKDPGNVRGMENLGWAYWLNNQEKEARQIFERMVQNGGDAESRGRSALADMAWSSGRYHEAARQLESGIVVDRTLGNSFALGKKELSLKASLLEAGSLSRVAENSSQDAVWNDPQLLFLSGLLYADAGSRSNLQAISERLDSAIKNNDVPTLLSFREILSAHAALLDHDPSAAAKAAERAVQFERSTLAMQVLGEAEEAASRPQDAISAYEEVLKRGAERSRSYDAPAYHELVMIHYRLGVLYQDVGDKNSARSHLQQFLTWWSHPEGKSKIYNDAKSRIRRLESADLRVGIPTPAM